MSLWSGMAGSRERGAAATIVAVLFAGGVLMGMAALSIDVGQAMHERRQLQNGADAAVIALAQDCAAKKTSCSPGAASSLQALAGLNAIDGTSELTSICGVGSGTGSLTTCASASTDYSALADCIPLPSGFKDPYVEARTATKTTESSNPTILPKSFSQFLVGGGKDVTVRACARAAWGPAGGTGLTLPLVASYCDWYNSTVGGTKFAPSPPYSKAPNATPLNAVPAEVNVPKYPVKLEAHDNTKDDSDLCGKDPNGQTYPGGFSWAQTCDGVDISQVPECDGVPPGTCIAAFDATGTVLAGSNGAPPPTACKKTSLDAFLGTEVFIPIGVSWDNASKSYKIDGIASFYLAGYHHIPTAGDNAVYKEPAYVCTGKCNGSSQYIWGWFTSGIKPVGSLGGGTPRGATVVQPIG